MYNQLFCVELALVPIFFIYKPQRCTGDASKSQFVLFLILSPHFLTAKSDNPVMLRHGMGISKSALRSDKELLQNSLAIQCPVCIV
jgi:hypothetical protein